MQRRHFHVYVDERFIETLYSGWSVSRIMRQLEKKYPDAKHLEIVNHDTESSTNLLRN